MERTVSKLISFGINNESDETKRVTVPKSNFKCSVCQYVLEIRILSLKITI